MKRDYRVLLVDLAQSYGGAEVRVMTQAKYLQDRVAHCAVAVLQNSPLHQRLQEMNLPCEPLSIGRGSPRMGLALRHIAQHGKYQLIDAHNVHSILWGHLGGYLGGTRGLVSTMHSDYGKEYPGLKGIFYESTLWLNRRIATEYITVTEVLQEKYAPLISSTLIHNAVPIPELPLPPKNPDLIRSWGFSPDDFIVVIPARLKPVKGHRYLIDAFAQLDDFPQVKLLIAGDGPLQPELEAQVNALNLAGRVHFAGFRQDIPAILQSVDSVCMASLSEALPYAVLEAGSYARPLLVTAVGGMATLLEDHKTALLVPPQDATALANGLRELVTRPEQTRQLGLAAYELVKNSFSTEVMIDKILKVYDNAVK
jgi:glycosyltransferase involved in cell wall biosynthesis